MEICYGVFGCKIELEHEIKIISFGLMCSLAWECDQNSFYLFDGGNFEAK